MDKDKKLLLAIGFNVAILLLILIVPNLPERYEFKVVVEPKTVRLGTEFNVIIDFKRIPDSCTLKIIDGATQRLVESKEFAAVKEKTLKIKLFAKEGSYSIGLHLAKVEAKYGDVVVVREKYFPVSSGLNISVSLELQPPILRLKPGENGTAMLKIRVIDELNRSVPNAMVWIWVEDAMASVVPNLSRTDDKGELTATLYLFPGNFTKVTVFVTVAKEGHPIDSKSLEVPIIRAG